ncbi:hypothetical protein, partial [Faecalibacterium sp. An77]|uniref:hypothetical protein n=1 Tax=Faecalibacterium sp. An77 TaxID=1965655 RepID=UPI00194E6B55
LRLADFCGAPRRALAKTGALRQLRPGCFVHWTRRAKAALDPDREVASFKSLKNTVMPARGNFQSLKWRHGCFS